MKHCDVQGKHPIWNEETVLNFARGGPTSVQLQLCSSYSGPRPTTIPTTFPPPSSSVSAADYATAPPIPGAQKGSVKERRKVRCPPHQAADGAVRFMAGLPQFDRLHRKAPLLAVRISSGGLHEAAAHTRWPWGSNGVKRTPSRAHKWYFIQPKDKLTGLENIFF